MRTVPYELMETICEALDLEPRFVSEIRFRAPRTIEALVYRRDADGAKHLGDRGVVLERISFEIASSGGRDAIREALLDDAKNAREDAAEEASAK